LRAVDLLTILQFVAGLVLLVVGAEVLVRGASSLALAVGISPLVVGLTVVAFGTSSPELAVSVSAVRSGKSDIAIGNVVGSNIMNILLILGLCSMVGALLIKWRLIRLEVPLMIALSVLLWVLVRDGRLARWESGLLVLGLVAYTVWAIRASRRESFSVQQVPAPGGEPQEEPKDWYVNLALIVGGFVLLVLGSTWMVDSAVEMATELGLSELVIGLTIVSIGTSLPELATSLLATFRGERDIAVGNVLGSNLFNILSVLGVSGLVTKNDLLANEAVRSVDLWVMIGAAAICLPVFYSGRNLMHRWEGSLFVGAYLLYVVYLVWSSSDAGVPGWYVDGLRFVLLPIALLVVLWTAWRDKRHPIPREALR
jgi:cation:H+ antiporter